MSSTEKKPIFLKLAIASVFAALIIGVAILFMVSFPAEKMPAPYSLRADYDKHEIKKAVGPSRVREFLDTILSYGSRFVGQKGFYATQNYVRNFYKEKGLIVYEQFDKPVVPKTQFCKMLDDNGKELQVKIYPFWPNHFQAIVSGPTLHGRLVLVNDSLIDTARFLSDYIAVIDKPPSKLGYDWKKYAQLGFKAVVVANPKGLSRIDWDALSMPGTMVSGQPLNYVRLAADERIFEYLGQRVNIQVKVCWSQPNCTTFVGIIKANSNSSEAVVIAAPYDAFSILPDTAVGSVQALALAAQLSLIEALDCYKDLFTRDVIFISYGSSVIAHHGLGQLVGHIGTALSQNQCGKRLKERLLWHQQQLHAIELLQMLCSEERFFDDPKVVKSVLGSMKNEQKLIFEEQYRYVMNTILFELKEDKLQTKIAFERKSTTDLTTAEFIRYTETTKRYDAAISAAGLPLEKLLQTKANFVAEYKVRQRFLDRLEELRKFHQEQTHFFSNACEINSLFSRYKRIIAIAPELITSPDTTKEFLSVGASAFLSQSVLFHFAEFSHLVSTLIQQLGLKDHVDFMYFGNQHAASVNGQTQIEYLVNAFDRYQHVSASFVNLERLKYYRMQSWPFEPIFFRNTKSIEYSLRIVAETALWLAMGAGRFKNPLPGEPQYASGTVVAEEVGVSIIPNYPLKNALIGIRNGASREHEFAGHARFAFILSDVYGRFDMADINFLVAPFNSDVATAEAAWIDSSGMIRYIKNIRAPGRFGSTTTVRSGADNKSTMRCFRASAVAIMDLINPQTLKPYSSVEFIDKETMTPFSQTNLFVGDGFTVSYLPADQRFYVLLKSGSAQNQLVQTVRAFILGPDSLFVSKATKGSEIRGDGFLAADCAYLIDVAGETARSVCRVNKQRLDLQDRYSMVDERTKEFQKKSELFLQQSLDPQKDLITKTLLKQESATYSILNHPVLRNKAFEAVIGILWYLALLIPFVFFFEKLTFSYTDVRKQIAAQAVIFLAAFMLLRVLHPAFAMIRSSLMILLGFIIFLISSVITWIFSHKFSENFEQLRKSQAKVSGAEVSGSGMLACSFMLGLNNMHRRKVRTWLTCTTLVLITFAMICFTSVTSDLVDRIVPVGKAGYQGFLVKNERFAAVSDAELFALQTRYSRHHKVIPRAFYVGALHSYSRRRIVPSFDMTFQKSADVITKVNFKTALELSYLEPLKDKIVILAGKGWFSSDTADLSNGLIPLLIPEQMAEKLGITFSMVNNSEVLVKLNGEPFVVRGIFDSRSLDNLRDIDGASILPFDIEALEQVNTIDPLSAEVVADETSARCRAERTLIAPFINLSRKISTQGMRKISSVAVVMENLSYRETKLEIEKYLEQTGKATYFGIDGIAYLGRRAREMSMAGFLDLLVPLLIAAITVLNTLKGSVYERRDEIFIYNAVGIAPRYIAFMFFAEALVYTVVGSVLGYILSQGIGKALTALNLSAGLNLTFASITTIYASVAVAAAVILSTYYPARIAMKIATPAENAGWSLPLPQNDTFQFQLPFTFNHRDRIAVLAFFNRYFLDHSEGSAGHFYASSSVIKVSEQLDKLNEDDYIPELSVRIWLKPFDLGVSQQLFIQLSTDAHTREYIATLKIHRLSGTVEAWCRLNKKFISLLRRHFLLWRAVPEDERQQMFEEGKAEIEKNIRNI